MPSPNATAKPTLVYIHAPCDTWWPLEFGPSCPMTHDDGLHRARKRRVWICTESEERNAYLTLAAFQEHLRELCHDT